MFTLQKTTYLLLVAALVALLAGCTSGGGDLRLNQNDVSALEQLYESSGWSFQESRVGIRVGGGGTVDVEVEGVAAPKTVEEDGAESLWVPVVLVRELPPYYRADEEAAKRPVEVQAYKAKEGLWCIVVAVQMPQQLGHSQPTPASAPTPMLTPTPAPGNNDVAESEAATPVRVRLTMVSPEFESGLPLLVPAGTTRGSTDASVTLDNARFSSLEFGGNEEIATRPAKLTVLPPQLSGGSVTAAAQLTPGASAAWDFSRVTYSTHSELAFEAVMSRRLVSLLVSLFLLGSLAATVVMWAREGERLRIRRETSARWRAAKAEASDIRRMAEREFGKNVLYELAVKLEKVFSTSKPGSYGVKEELKSAEAQLAAMRSEIEKARQELSEREKQSQTNLSGPTVEADGEERDNKAYERLHELERRLDHLEQVCQPDEQDAKSREVRNRYSLLLLALVFLIAAWLLSTLVRGQAVTTQATPTPPPWAAELREFGLATKPAKPDSDERDKVSVALDFYPTVNEPPQNGKVKAKNRDEAKDRDALEINTDDAQAVIENFTLTGPKQLELISKGRTQAVVSVPTIKEHIIGLPKSQTDSKTIESVRLLAAYNPDKKDVIKLSFDVRNVQTFNDRANGWLHWFPWETIEVKLPLRLNRSAQMWNAEMQKPSTDYVAVPQVDDVIGPFDAKTGQKAFVEDYNRYRFSVGDSLSRKVIRPNTKVTFKAEFQRTGLQRFMLTWFILLVALVVGLIVGFKYSSPATLFLPLFVETFGLAGLYLGLWGLVFTKFTNIPTIFLGQGITVSELFFLVGWLILLGTSYLVMRLR